MTKTNINNAEGKESNGKRENSGICPLLTQSLVSKIWLGDINYFLSEGRRTQIVLRNGRSYHMGEKLAFFEKFLDENFYLFGKYYINLCRIESINSDAVVTFDDGTKLYFTKKTYVELKQRFARFILEGPSPGSPPGK